jgi:SAM-dependent methyltransferase
MSENRPTPGLPDQPPATSVSTRPVVGPAITKVRNVLERAYAPTTTWLINQVNAALHQVNAALSQVVTAVDDQFAEVRQNLTSVDEHLHRLESSVDELDLPSRLGRLERRSRAESLTSAHTPPGNAGGTAAHVGSTPDVAFDYFAFEELFRGTEATIRERQSGYIEALAGSRKVVDLGCGRGELLELLREADVDAYGVDLEPDFVQLVESKGLRAVRDDIQAHLNRLAIGEVDGIVVSHVVEHLAPSEIYALIQRAADVLSAGGVLIVETPNPESLMAGSVNFHRDPTHRRPIHPDTLAFLCQSAGFEDVAIRRLARVPDDSRLPLPSGLGDEAVTTYLGVVVQQLNELIYGYQDFAVVARKR